MAEKNCKCGHPRQLHRNDRGMDGRNPCRGEVRQFVAQLNDEQKRQLRDSDIQLTELQAVATMKEYRAKAKKAPSYSGQLDKLLKRGFRIVDCQCKLYHTIDIGGVLIHKVV